MVTTPPSPKKADTGLSVNFVIQLGVDSPADKISKPDAAALRDLNFKIPPELHRDFKLISTELGLSMRDFLEHLLDLYCRVEATQLGEDVNPTALRRLARIRDAKR